MALTPQTIDNQHQPTTKMTNHFKCLSSNVIINSKPKIESTSISHTKPNYYDIDGQTTSQVGVL